MNTAAPSLTRALCHHHPQREAAAKCVGCARAFCRECVTPMDRRMYCADCYRELTAPKETKRRDWFLPSVVVQAVVGFVLLWFTAYLVGRFLFELPHDWHEGTVWERFSGED